MTTRILHVTDGPGHLTMQIFASQNPHGKLNQRDLTVETFGIIHYFRRIRNMEDCYKLTGIDFNSLVVHRWVGKREEMEWLMSRCRQAHYEPRESTLKLVLPEKIVVNELTKEQADSIARAITSAMVDSVLMYTEK